MRAALIGGVLCLMRIAAHSPGPQDVCRLSGHIVNASTGEGVRKADITIYRKDDYADKQRMLSREGGAYEFRNLRPGQYAISVSAQGFVKYYPELKKPGEGGFNDITLAPGEELKDIVIRLTPQGVITGRVQDEDGDPKANASVQVFAPKGGAFRRIAGSYANGQTNDVGEYRIAGLHPGDYVVMAMPSGQSFSPPQRLGRLPEQPEEISAPTFYPGVVKPDAASTVTVRAGAETQNIDIRLLLMPSFRIRGRVIDGRTGRPVKAMVSLEPKERRVSELYPLPSTYSSTGDGLFELTGIYPGLYFLRAVSQEETNSTGVYCILPVTITGSHVAGLEVVMTGGTDVPGKVRQIGAPKGIGGDVLQDKPQILLRSIDREQGSIMVGTERIDEDGTFVLKLVRPGRYLVDVWGFGFGYIRKAMLGELDVTGKDIDYSAGVTTTPINVEIAHDSAVVSGSVKDKDGAGIAGAKVGVFAEVAPGKWVDYPTIGNTDQRGNFVIRGLRPGEYRVLAARELDPEDLGTPGFAAFCGEKARKLKAQPDGNESIDLQVLSPEELAAAREKRGM